MEKYSVVYNNEYFTIVIDELAERIIKSSFESERLFLGDGFNKKSCIAHYSSKGLKYQVVNECNFFKYFHTDFDDYYSAYYKQIH